MNYRYLDIRRDPVKENSSSVQKSLWRYAII